MQWKVYIGVHIVKTERVAEGIYKRTTDAESSSYFCRFKVNGKSIVRGLGSTKEVSLRDAKLRYAEIVSTYKDPTPKHLMKDLLPQAMDDIEEVRMWKHESSRYGFRTALTVNAAALHEKDVAEVTNIDVLEVLKPLWSTAYPKANNLRRSLKAFYAWCIAHGYRSAPNPAAWQDNLEVFLPKPGKVHKTKHHEAATVDEAKDIVARCVAKPDAPSLCILLCILTASRTTEVLHILHDEVKDGTWIIPPEVRKDSKSYPHRVPMSALALWAVDRLRAVPFEGPYGGKLTSHSLLERIRRWGYPKITSHGFRSTFRDWCAVNGVPDAVAEKQLMHSWGCTTTQAYYREDLLEARRPVMEQWGRTLSERQS